MTGEQCRRRRQARRWSQQRLANASGVNKAYISEFETGLRELDGNSSRAVATALAGPCDCQCCSHKGRGR